MLPKFNVVKYVDANGIPSAAIKKQLPNGLSMVLVQKANLPKDKAIAMSMDTFLKKELPQINATKIHAGDSFKKN